MTKKHISHDFAPREAAAGFDKKIMKLIDFHTHFFPDSIAAGAVKRIETAAGVKAWGNGTLDSLKARMKEDGVSVSVNLPVATRPDQVKSINKKMIEHNKSADKSIICFGAMHPEFSKTGDFAEEIEYLSLNGIKGIKLHPEYQEFFPDDGRLKKLYDACVKYKMIVVMHAGADPVSDEVRAMPNRTARVASIKGLKLVLAHMGGYAIWDAVYRHLAGTDVLFDTAYTQEMEWGMMKGMIETHGAGKILFGSDFPWARAGVIREKIESAADESAREKIFYKNAETLLGISL